MHLGLNEAFNFFTAYTLLILVVLTYFKFNSKFNSIKVTLSLQCTTQQTVEPMSMSIERIETAPFFRLSRRVVGGSHEGVGEIGSKGGSHHIMGTPHGLDKGQIHTKRHSAEDPSKIHNSTSVSAAVAGVAAVGAGGVAGVVSSGCGGGGSVSEAT